MTPNTQSSHSPSCHTPTANRRARVFQRRALTSSTQTICEIQNNADLIQDYQQVLQPPLANALQDTYVSVLNPNAALGSAAELITLNNKNQPVHILRDLSSNSGWNIETITLSGAPSSTPQQLLGFYDNSASGNLYCFSLYGKEADYTVCASYNQLNISPVPGWAALDLSSGSVGAAMAQMSSISLYTDQSGNSYLYGMSQSFTASALPTFLIVAIPATSGTPNTDDWSVIPYNISSGDEKAIFRLLPGYSGNPFTFAIFNGDSASFQGAEIDTTEGTLDLLGEANTFTLGLGTLTPDHVVPVPSSTGEQGVLVVGNDEQLYLLSGYEKSSTFQETCLSGTSGQPNGILEIACGSINSADNPSYVAFALDSTNSNLWILREDTDNSGAVTFSDWVQLGDAVDYIACPREMVEVGQVFMYSETNAVVSMMQQNASTFIWKSGTVMTPSATSDTPAEASTYSSQFTLLGSTGNALPNTMVQVSADQHCTVILNGISYQLDSNNSVEVSSSSTGRINISIEATALSSPQIVFADTSGNSLGDFTADTLTQQRLAGQDSSFEVSGSTLISAGLVSKGTKKGTADSHAKNIKSMGQASVTLSSSDKSLPDGTVIAPAWSCDFSEPANPIFRELSDEEVGALLEKSKSATAQDFGDVCHWFSKEYKKLKTVTVDAVKKGETDVTIVLNDVKYVLDDAEQVAGVIGTYLVKIAEDVGILPKALAWLQLLLDWKDIVNTQKVLSYLSDQTFTNSVDFLKNQAPAYINEAFSTAQTTIEDTFASLQSNIGDTTLGDLVTPKKEGSTYPTSSEIQSAYSNCSMLADYIFDKIVNAIDNGLIKLDFTDLTDDGTTSSFQNFLSSVESATGNSTVTQAAAQLETWLTGVAKENPADWVLSDLLTASEDLLLGVVDVSEDLVNDVVSFAPKSIQSFQKKVSESIEIPLLSGLYSKLTDGETMTFSNLCNLAFAVQITRVNLQYTGSASIFSSSQVKTITSTPISWSGLPPAGGGISAKLSAAKIDSTTLQALAAAGVMGSVLYFFMDTMADYINIEIQAGDSPPAEERGLTSLSALMILNDSAIFSVTSPMNILNGSQAPTSLDVFVCFTWGSNLIRIVLDIASTLSPPTNSLVRFYAQYGPWVGFGFGCLNSLFAVFAAVSAGTGIDDPYDDSSDWGPWWTAGSLFAAPFALCDQVLVFDLIEPEYQLPAFLGCNGIGDIGSFVANYVSYLDPPKKVS